MSNNQHRRQDRAKSTAEQRSRITVEFAPNAMVESANDALRASEERFRLMADTAPVMIWISGPDRLCTWFNRPWLDFVGRSIEQELGEGWAENVHSDDKGRCLETYTTAFDTRQPFSMEYRLRRHDGEYRWLLDNGVPFNGADGEFAGYIGSCIDITDRKASELALRESEHRARSMAAIVESSEDAIASISLDGRFVSWNNAAERIFGYTAGEIIGQPMVRLAAPSYVTEMVEIVERIRRGGHIDHYETKRLHKDGRLLDVSLTESPIYDADRQLIGISKVLRDITAAKAAEAALRESQTRLQELHSELLRVSRLSAMGQMSATVTHELNQPLTAITNYMAAAAGIVDRGGEVPLSRLRNILERASEQATRAGDIIERLRVFMSRGDMEKRIEAVPPLLQEAAQLVLIGIKQKGIGISIQSDLPNVKIHVDKVQIQQVLLNLLRNAAEAVADQDDRRVSLAAAAGDGFVQIGVSDNGSGLPEEVQANLFQPFVSTKRNGMGIGLSICHTIVSAHRGSISAEPNPGGGTIFRITLPVAREDE